MEWYCGTHKNYLTKKLKQEQVSQVVEIEENVKQIIDTTITPVLESINFVRPFEQQRYQIAQNYQKKISELQMQIQLLEDAKDKALQILQEQQDLGKQVLKNQAMKELLHGYIQTGTISPSNFTALDSTLQTVHTHLSKIDIPNPLTPRRNPNIPMELANNMTEQYDLHSNIMATMAMKQMAASNQTTLEWMNVASSNTTGPTVTEVEDEPTHGNDVPMIQSTPNTSNSPMMIQPTPDPVLGLQLTRLQMNIIVTVLNQERVLSDQDVSNTGQMDDCTLASNLNSVISSDIEEPLKRYLQQHHGDKF
eukprot:TRINITY_DN1775_c0_g1_i1.p1 TRINITY_DN1775_c0_g1~~TRINITY_DN1775_c0_g1_i1.p1  ORF type:complete len:307 (-),score=58.67 TRINITY_DN1775_c0_g1_i1:19-939(-)